LELKKEEMTRIVNEELKHIPRTGKHIYDSQADLRGMYNAMRRHDLKFGKTKEETLLRCIELLKRQNPSWQPMFDRNYFSIMA
jgi:hypothetical protein